MNTITVKRKTNNQNLLIAQKLHSLVDTLQNANRGFKRIADNCVNRKTQIVVFGLATESYQFYKEISSYLQVLEEKPVMSENVQNSFTSEPSNEAEGHDDSSKVLDECTHIEKNLITEFRKLMNDNLITGDLRKLLQEHLNGFLYAFVKLKMLRNYNSSTIDYGILF